MSAYSQAFSQLDSNVSESNAGGDGESAYGKCIFQITVSFQDDHYLQCHFKMIIIEK